MIPAIIAGIVSGITALGKSWLETRKVKAAGKIEVATAEIKAKVTKIEKEAEMDIQSTNDMRYSWKDAASYHGRSLIFNQDLFF